MRKSFVKKLLGTLTAALLAVGTLAGCGKGNGAATAESNEKQIFRTLDEIKTKLSRLQVNF